MNRKNLERGFSFGLYTSQSIYLEIFYKSIDKKISILYTNFTKKSIKQKHEKKQKMKEKTTNEKR